MITESFPEQLKDERFRFIKLAENGKNAIEKNWQVVNNYLYSEILESDKIKNYGVLCGDGLLVIDFDDKLTQNSILPLCPMTFAIKTAVKGLLHLYYFVDQDINKKMGIADFQGKGAYVVGAGSSINKKKYEIFKDAKIHRLTSEEFQKIKNGLEKINKTYSSGCINFRNFLKNVSEGKIRFREGQQKNGVLLPNASSFFQHDAGLISAFCGIIEHKEAEGKGWCSKQANFNCNQFRSWLDKHYPGTSIPCDCESENKIKDWITAKELYEADVKEPEWLVKNIISEGGLTAIIGSPKSSKTWFALYLAVCVSKGADLFGKFSTKKGRVCYIDEENGTIDMKDRYKRLVDGLEMEKDLDIDFVIYKDIKLDCDKSSLKKHLEEYIQKRKPVLIIFDSMVRFMIGDENSSKDVRKIFDNLKQLKEKYGVSFLLLHHTTKNTRDARGSGDWKGQVNDMFLLNRKKGKHVFYLKSEVARRANWISSIEYQIEGEEGKPISFSYLGDSSCVVEEKKVVAEILADEITNWMKDKKISQFKREELPAELKEPTVPKTRVTDALNYLTESGNLKKSAHGFYEFVSQEVKY